MKERELSRRDMIVQSGLAVGAALISTSAEAQRTAAPVPEGELKTLTRLEYDTLDAICSRPIPTDENGPGAREARAARYIDWGLSGALNAVAGARGRGGAPQASTATMREQYAAALAAVEAHAVSTKGNSFSKLAPADQDAIVTLLQNSQIPNAPTGADVVFISSQTLENVRLLLLSTSAAFPKGLSNNHGQVGKHYFSHAQFGAVSAVFPMDLRNWYGTPGQGICCDDWADDNFDHTGLNFIGGGTLYVYGERRPLAAVNAVQNPGGPNWGSAWKKNLINSVDRTNGAYMQRSTFPYEGNYLDLDPSTRDPLGNPVIRITASFRENEERISLFVGEKMREWYMAAGAVQVTGNGLVRAGSAMGNSTHAYGGTRMGKNPETNVLNEWGISHEVPNLAIAGGSVMGTSGARNPTLTLQALAWRTAEHIARRWKAIVR